MNLSFLITLVKFLIDEPSNTTNRTTREKVTRAIKKLVISFILLYAVLVTDRLFTLNNRLDKCYGEVHTIKK